MCSAESLRPSTPPTARRSGGQTPRSWTASAGPSSASTVCPSIPFSDAYHAVGLVILKAHVRAYGLLLQRHEGEPVETSAPPVPAAASKGPKLSEAFEAWKAGSGARGGKKPSDRTLLEASYVVRRLTEWHGDIRLGDLTRSWPGTSGMRWRECPPAFPTS